MPCQEEWPHLYLQVIWTQDLLVACWLDLRVKTLSCRTAILRLISINAVNDLAGSYILERYRSNNRPLGAIMTMV